MRLLTLRVIAFMSALALFVAESAAQTNGRESPLCGQHLTIGNITYTIAAQQDTRTGGCTGTTTPDSVVRVLGSPSGLANGFGSGAFPGLPMSTDAGGDELWIVPGNGCVVLDATYSLPAQELECFDEVEPEVIQPYIQLPTTGGLLRPTFGGAGLLGITFLWSHQDLNYGPTGLLMQGRSTDVDGDGDTDEADMKALIAAFGTQNLQYDLNWDNQVDEADLAILLQESVRRDANNHPYRRGHCDGTGNIVGYDMSHWRPIRPAAPPVVATPSCNSITVSWTNTGNDSLAGTASAFYVHRSSSAITNEAQWAAAIEVGYGAPGASGTTGSVEDNFGPCSATYFYAVRMQDDEGNMSAISCIASGVKTFCPRGGYCDDGLVEPGDTPDSTPLVFALAPGTATILRGSADFRFTIPVRDQGKQLLVSVVDVNGRAVMNTSSKTTGQAETVVKWNLSRADSQRVPPGVYFLRGTLGTAQVRQRLVVLP